MPNARLTARSGLAGLIALAAAAIAAPAGAQDTPPAWAYPVVANGRLYVRDQELLFCYDVKK